MKKIAIVFLLMLVLSTTSVLAVVLAPTQVNEGWNLLYGVSSPDQFGRSAIANFDPSNIKAIYGYSPSTKEYIRFYPDPEEDKKNLFSGIYQTAFWVYSTKQQSDVLYWTEDSTPYYDRQLYKGWNFVGASSDMFNTINERGNKFLAWNNVRGDCKFMKIYFYDSFGVRWLKQDYDLWLMPSFQNRGFVVNVADDCKLGKPDSEQIAPPPSIPQ